jgi:lipoprotein-anchoring transpeptidase ErfK/SrfK
LIVPRESQEIAPRARSMAAEAPPRRAGVLREVLRVIFFVLLGAGVAGLGVAVGLAKFGGSYAKSEEAFARAAGGDPDVAASADKIERRLGALAPKRETYVVVDTYRNRLRVFKGGEMLREAICSTGSGVKLRDPRNGREWVFDTPSGEVRIWRKRKDPIWVKPDWAFIEEGYEPPRGMRDRVDDFSLGDYALDMPDGYLIHGTVFQSLLGRRVTHGCIRLGDQDLKFVYDTVPVGARVFLF